MAFSGMINVKSGQLTLRGQFEAYKRGQLERNIQFSGSVQLSVSFLFIILGSLVFPCGGMTGGRRPEGRPPQGMVYIL
jgi:heme/copper-type cytochrome/quinol oxidase subunit 1